MIYGPPAHHIASPADLNESNARIYNLFVNSSRTAELPPNGLYLYVDVRVSVFPFYLPSSLLSFVYLPRLKLHLFVKSSTTGYRNRPPPRRHRPRSLK